MAIVLAERPEQELERLMNQSLVTAAAQQMRRFESDIWWLGKHRVRCVVVRKPVRGKTTYVRTLQVDGRACGLNDLRWQLRHEK